MAKKEKNGGGESRSEIDRIRVLPTFPLEVFRTQPVRPFVVATFLVWELCRTPRCPPPRSEWGRGEGGGRYLEFGI